MVRRETYVIIQTRFSETSLVATALPAVADATASTKASTNDSVTPGQVKRSSDALGLRNRHALGRSAAPLGPRRIYSPVRYAYDGGIRFFETTDAYHHMPEMLAVAFKEILRESYRLMTKYDVHHSEDSMAAVHRLKAALSTEYVDIELLHYVHNPNWPEETKHLQGAFQEAKEKKLMLAHGASVHVKQAVSLFPGNPFLDVAMIRMDHNGAIIDRSSTQDVGEKGKVYFVVDHMQRIKAGGARITSMKLVGEGRSNNPEDRQAALNFTFRKAGSIA